MYVYRNFKSCLQNLNLHVKPQDLDNSIPNFVIQTRGPSLISGDATLKIRTVFWSSGALKLLKGGGSYIFVVHSNLNFQMKCGSSRSVSDEE